DRVKNEPLSPLDALVYEAFSRLEEKDYRGMAERLSEAIPLCPDGPVAGFLYFQRGYAFQKLEEHRKSIEDFDRALERNPEDGEAYGHRGFSRYLLKEFEQAIADYDMAASLCPKKACFFFDRGVCHGEIGDHQGAIQDYDRAAELEPGDPSIFY